MSEHLSTATLRKFVDGDFPVSDISAMSTHIVGCQECKDRLIAISPDFIEPDQVPDSVTFEETDHFNEDELRAFAQAKLPVGNRLEMSKHIRACDACKANLYSQDPAIMMNTVSSILEDEDEKESFFPAIRLLVPTGALVLVLFGLLYFVFLSTGQPDNTVAVAENPQELANKSKNLSPDNTNLRSAETKTAEKTAADMVVATETNTKNVRSTNTRTKKGNLTEKKTPAKKRPKNPSTSRSTNNASRQNAITIVSPKGGIVRSARPTFKWNAVRGAVKYNVYVSNTAQILIEEAQVIGKTSYTLQKSLKPGKKYRLRVLAETADGRSPSSNAVDFEVVPKTAPVNQKNR